MFVTEECETNLELVTIQSRQVLLYLPGRVGSFIKLSQSICFKKRLESFKVYGMSIEMVNIKITQEPNFFF